MKGYVYLICDPAVDMFKIGVTRNINSNRIKKLQTGNPTELHIVNIYKTEYPFRLEKMLHMYFQNKHELNEWFSLDIEDICSFTNVCNELMDRINILLDNPFFAKNIK